MKNKLRAILEAAAKQAREEGLLPPTDIFPEIEIEVPKINTHGDFSTNIAMTSASDYKMPPRKIAEVILSKIDEVEGSEQIIRSKDMAGPGFINFFIQPAAWQVRLREVDQADTAYGACDLGKGEKIQVEFVSANPTGPLHVGHGRGAAVGDSLTRILSFCGWQVEKEYYINDAGNQIMTLGRSVFLRLKELAEENVDFPEDCYQGDYIRRIAQDIKDNYSQALQKKDDATAIAFCAEQAQAAILDGIRQDLAQFDITFDCWFSEKTLVTAKAVNSALELMQKNGLAYTAEGALWFKSSALGDEKDRVMVRKNGETTYFASDIAYHKNKFERGFSRVIDIWGADHHGYVPRMKAAIQALGKDRDALDIILIQLVNLLRQGEPVSMSTRSGEFVTLQEVVDEVGSDAARFIFLSRHYDSPLDFDLELAKQKNNDNPVYYVQYVHARISSMMRKAKEDYQIETITASDAALARLEAPEELELIKTLTRYPEAVETAARLMEPHRITFYLMELAAAFHSYYNRHKVLTDDNELSQGRLFLVSCVKKVIRNGLALLGVSAPESM